MPHDDKANTWLEWSQFVLKSLKSAKEERDQINEKLLALMLAEERRRANDSVRSAGISAAVSLIIVIIGGIVIYKTTIG